MYILAYYGDNQFPDFIGAANSKEKLEGWYTSAKLLPPLAMDEVDHDIMRHSDHYYISKLKVI